MGVPKPGTHRQHIRRSRTSSKSRVVELRAFRSKKRFDEWRQKWPAPKRFFYFVVLVLSFLSVGLAVWSFFPGWVFGAKIIVSVFCGVFSGLGCMILYSLRYRGIQTPMSVSALGILIALVDGYIRFGLHY